MNLATFHYMLGFILGMVCAYCAVIGWHYRRTLSGKLLFLLGPICISFFGGFLNQILRVIYG